MDKIKLVMVDLDETILFSNTEISKATSQTIQRLLDNNIEVVIATGRYFQSIPQIFIDNKRIKYIVSSNGALITNNQTNAIIYNKDLDYKTVLSIIEKADNKDRHMFISTTKGVFIDENLLNDKLVDSNEFFKLLKSHAVVVKDMYSYIKENKQAVKKIEIAFNDLKFRDDLYTYLQTLKDVTIVSSHHTNIEATNQNVSKGLALEFLIDQLNLNKDETLAIGDNDNDLSMIQMAGIGIAMKNSSPLLLENADLITASIDDDGFTKAIERIFNF